MNPILAFYLLGVLIYFIAKTTALGLRTTARVVDGRQVYPGPLLLLIALAAVGAVLWPIATALHFLYQQRPAPPEPEPIDSELLNDPCYNLEDGTYDLTLRWMIDERKAREAQEAEEKKSLKP